MEISTIGPPVLGVEAPVFFFSVSGAAKSHLTPLDHLRALRSFRADHVLVSAYDIAHATARDRSEIVGILADLRQAGTQVLLDSGSYEASWLRDETWSLPDFLATAADTPHDLAFSFDSGHEDPLEAARESAHGIADSSTLIPIAHGPSKTLPSLVVRLATEFKPHCVAVTERELGDGMFEAADTLEKVFAQLTVELGAETPALHVLGAGNPRSLLLYTTCGASAFDGLDWCQTAANFESATLHHSKHLDLYAHQSGAALANANYFTRLLGHNYTFFSNWTGSIRSAIAGGTIDKMLQAHVPRGP